MQAVNLLPRELLAAAERSKVPLPMIGAGAVPLISLALVVTGYLSAHSQIGAQQSQLAAVNAQLAELAPSKLKQQAAQEAASAKTSVLTSERTARLTSLESAMASTPVTADQWLDVIARVIPPNVWLTGLTVAQVAPGGATAGSFTISGYTYSQPAVAQLLARLQLIPTLTNVQLGTSAQATVGTRTLVQFTITATPGVPVAAAPPAATTTPATTTPATTTPATPAP